MQYDKYNSTFWEFFESQQIRMQIKESISLLKESKKLFFIGNGGSNSICSHMMEDYAKTARFRTFSFSDPALITCFCNDYGYENAIGEWLKIYIDKNDLLIAISSSGMSKNIVHGAEYARTAGAKIITLSGFKDDNMLKSKGDINFHLPVNNYGIVECFHQVILHVILDEITL